MYAYPLINECEKYPPLSVEDEKKYLLLAKQGDRMAAETVFNHNIRLIFKVVSSFKPDYRSGGYEVKEDVEDLIIDLAAVLWNTIGKFDIEKNYRFSTYAYRSLLNRTFTFARKNKVYKMHFLSPVLSPGSNDSEKSLTDLIPAYEEIDIDLIGTTPDEKILLESLMAEVPKKRFMFKNKISSDRYDELLNSLREKYSFLIQV